MSIVLLARRHPRLAMLTGAAVIFAAIAAWIRLGPIDHSLLDDRASPSTVVVDRRGVVLYEALSSDGARRVKLSPGGLPPLLVAATVAAEDHRFWSHAGVDPVAVGRALKRNLTERRIVEGGSTISQQVAKLLLTRRHPGRRRGFRVKVHEAVLALRLEHRFDKRTILAMYLNLAAYGDQLIGAERASRAYFGHPASMLTAAQAAFLAGLPQRPAGFHPHRKRDAAIGRQRIVLRRMEAVGALTADQLREARMERLAFAPSRSSLVAPHFVEMVVAAAAEPRAARIETTLDAELQSDVTGIIESHRLLLQKHNARNVAVVVLDNATGGWLAWEGSGDYFDGEHGGAINGPLTPRQPGSALKPFTYALAFEEGFSPATVLPDVPSHFATAEPGVVYSPRNYDGRYRGPLLARRALAGSENVPAVALASELGVPKLLRFLRRAGFTTFDRNASYYGLGITLGNAEVRLDELVAAYAAFARGGEWIPPSATLPTPSATRDFGSAAGSSNRTGTTLVSPRTAFWIGDILSDADAREFIFGRGGHLEFPFPVAVKTGTSQAYHDNWTIGFSRHVTVGVWVGNFDRKPLRDSTGVTGAAPIFHAVMLAAERRAAGTVDDRGFPGLSIVPPPEGAGGVIQHEICALSGMTANASCPSRRREWVSPDRLPLLCSWHHLADGGFLLVWPPEYRQWARQNGLLEDTLRRPATVVPATHIVASGPVPEQVPLQIVNPPAGAVYLIDPTLRRDFQTLPLRVVAARPGRIEWSVDGRLVGASNSDAALMWPLSPGSHRVTARDDQGHRAEATLIVR